MSKLMELVQQYGDRIVGASLRDHKSEDDANKAARLLSEIRAAVQELERDAARFRHLQNIDKKEAQAFFWAWKSRKERASAIDAAMEAANVPE